MNCRSALVLVGGVGTRLGHLTKLTPKPLLSIGDVPFLLYLLRYLESQGFTRAVLAAHFQGNQFVSFCNEYKFDTLTVNTLIEAEPLGTGGAIVNAASEMPEEFYVMNGDTLSETDFNLMERQYFQSGCPIVVGLKKGSEFGSRYGLVKVSPAGVVTGFFEKTAPLSGSLAINTGMYYVKKSFFLELPNEKFSLEMELFPSLVKSGRLAGVILEGKFIDIGTPESFSDAKSFCEGWRI